jgi:hypothetical protein
MGILRIVVVIVVAVVVGVGLLFAVARVGDGPLGPLPGGPLEAGELVSEPVTDWGFAEDIETIEMQLAGEDTSRTTWVLVDSGRAYIPSSLGFPPGKTWYERADQSGDAFVRIEGRRYPVRLQRVHEEKTRRALAEIANEKYGGGPPGDAEVWFFVMESRES